MSIASEITVTKGLLGLAYDKIGELGGEVPEQRNMQNLAAAVKTITGGGWNPQNPTLDGLQDAINKGIDIEIGTEIPDKYDDQDNPLIVAQKLDSSNNSSYGGAEGYILVRKYINPTSQIFDSSSGAYTSSAIKTFLDNTYSTKCSDTLNSLVANISIPYTSNGTSVTQINCKFFLLSGIEMNGTYNNGDGIAFDYWKNKTQLSTPSNAANNGRIVTSLQGSPVNYWLRSRYLDAGATNNSIVNTTGLIGGSSITSANVGVLVGCFIEKK